MAKVHDIRDFGKVLDKELQKNAKQIRYAMMRAANETAFDIKKELEKAYRESFHVRNSNLPKRILVKKATKQNLCAEVEFPYDWMYLNTQGGTKKPDKAPQLFVPINPKIDKSRTPGGKIKRFARPGALLKYYSGHSKDGKSIKKKGRVAKTHAFLMESRRSGQTLIAQRDVSDRRQLNFLYVGVKTAKVMNKWDFDKIAGETAARNLPRRFDEEYLKAMRTAR